MKGSSLSGAKRTLINIIERQKGTVNLTGNGKYIVIDSVIW